MNKLHKSAWFNLGFVTIGCFVGILCFVLAASRIEEGFNHINVILCLIALCIIIPIVLIIARKKSYEAGFDEREKMIDRQATTLSVYGLVIFLYLTCFIPFVALGGGNTIKIIYLPVVFVCTVFISQLIKSVTIIVQCKLEQDNG